MTMTQIMQEVREHQLVTWYLTGHLTLDQLVMYWQLMQEGI